MHQTVQYKTFFVKMTRDPAKFAQNLEDKLNEFSREGWSMTRLEHDMKKGALLVAHRVDPEGMKRSLVGHPLAALLGLSPPEDDHKTISPQSAEIVNQIMAKTQASKGDNPESKVQSAVEAICRRYPSPVLRTTAAELKETVKHHREHAHDTKDEQCPMSDELELIAAVLEKQIALSVV